MKKFEYKVLEVPSKGFWGYKVDYDKLNATLNELGSRGWEVTSITAMNMTHGGSQGLIILKRETTH